MLRTAIVGFGFMGRMHYRCWRRTPGAVVAAVCEKNPQALKASGGGNIAGAEEAIDLSGVEIFEDFDAMLASGRVDAVSLALPTHLHAPLAVRALEAGLHVLCEKPMALSLEECDLMIAAARGSNRVLQIAHCIRFWPEYAKTRDLVAGGEYGRVAAASFRRLGSMPAWGDVKWFADEARSGGMALDLHIHDTDYIHHLFGMPKAVCSATDAEGLYMITRYAYDSGVPVTAEGSWRLAPSFGFEMSFNLILERATIAYDCTRTPAFRVCPFDGPAFTPPVEPGDGYTRQIEHFARTIRGEAVPPVISLPESRDSIRIVLAEKQSAREGRRVEL